MMLTSVKDIICLTICKQVKHILKRPSTIGSPQLLCFHGFNSQATYANNIIIYKTLQNDKTTPNFRFPSDLEYKIKANCNPSIKIGTTSVTTNARTEGVCSGGLGEHHR